MAGRCIAPAMTLFTDTAILLDRDCEERRIALEYIAEAWNGAEGDGIESEALAHAALFAALATLVRLHGEQQAAELVAALPERMRRGDYSLNRSIQ